MAELEINIADITKIPPVIAQLLLKQEDIVELGTKCGEKRIDDCWYVVRGPKEKLEGINEIFKEKGIRTKLKDEFKGIDLWSI